jgi:fumarate hydratase class II
MTTRWEHDSLGAIEVDADRYWGAQTQRSLGNFSIGAERFPRVVIWALGAVKKACAEVNRELGQLPESLAGAIATAADEVISGALDDHFPLVVFQTGSGTQTNMNANEVIANRSIEILGGVQGSKNPVHPNDHVNLGQSSNDVFPTVMHLATVDRIQARLLPQVEQLRATLDAKAQSFRHVVKIGRTHLMDATPLTLGNAISGWAAQLDIALQTLRRALPPLHDLALGGTAVGTGLNTHPEFGARTAARLAEITGYPFTSAPNKFAALAGHEAMATASGACRTLAAALMKIANDTRWLASGPRSGIGEITLPANEPGSSIMPGKVNPTQAEALAMVCCQVMGNDATVGFAASQGNLELNVFKPVILANVLSSIRLLADACESFEKRCAAGIEPNRDRIARHLERSFMLVTALAPVVGYDVAAQVAEKAHSEGKTLREAALEIGVADAKTLDEVLNPETMLGPREGNT